MNKRIFQFNFQDRLAEGWFEPWGTTLSPRVELEYKDEELLGLWTRESVFPYMDALVLNDGRVLMYSGKNPYTWIYYPIDNVTN